MKHSDFMSGYTIDSGPMLYMCAVCQSKYSNCFMLDEHIKNQHSKYEIDLYQATSRPGVKEYLQVYGNR